MGGEAVGEEDKADIFTRYWRYWVLVCWLAGVAYLLWDRWGMIRSFTLPDTDDNMRMMQVRALLAGQDWFDLRQYRLDPPFGANIHWSRLVDLPIAAIMLALRPFLGGRLAETVAVAVAPMLPMLVGLAAVTATARRLISPKSILIAAVLLLCAHATRLMWSPMRIDHHGWQLAFLSLVAASFSDRDKARGGLTLGLATAASLAIGLEMLAYLVVAGALVGLMWIRDPEERPRMLAYGAALAGGTAFGFLVFASIANREPVCDALSPVWLSVMVCAGALSVALALLRPKSLLLRLSAAAAGGVAIAVAFALAWPHCLGRLEGVPPEAQRLWLDHVREAKPIFRQSPEVTLSFLSLPVIGLVGYAVMIWRSRREPASWTAWTAAGVLALTSLGLLLWQTRAGAASQLIAVPGVTGLAWTLLLAIHRSRLVLVRVLGSFVGFFLVSGLAVQVAAVQFLAPKKENPGRKLINRANGRCPTLAALHPVALQPKGYVLTFVDLGPRLITVTHHDAVAGPYHRNAAAIVDVMETFRGSPDRALDTVRRRKIDYVLICPNFSESTNYKAAAPNGFYAQLLKGKVPAWLVPVALPKDSPFRMWRVQPPVRSRSST